MAIFSIEEGSAMKRAFVNGYILDGTKGMTAREGMVLLTDGARIEKLVPPVPTWRATSRWI
jgi:hypothetical protein